MIIKKSVKNNSTLKHSRLDAHPIISFFIEKLKLPDILCSYLPHDERLTIDHDRVLRVLIHNILTSPTPLYEIPEWLLPYDEEVLGISSNEMECFNDDRIGKSLTSFYQSRHKEVFFRLALRAIKLFHLDCRQIHQDTTTITFHGKYKSWGLEPLMAHGINKDYRPDLKQLVLGMSVTSDGAVPLVHQIYDGNQTDDRVHISNHVRLCRLLQFTDFIYVADCKLATEANLGKINACGGLFVTVMPRTWGESRRFLEKAERDKIKWSFLCSRIQKHGTNIKEAVKKDTFHLANGNYKTEQGYRLLWIKSSIKEELDLNQRLDNMEKTVSLLRSIQSGLNRYTLKTREGIEKKVKAALAQYKCELFITYTISSRLETIKKHKKAGRPKQGGKTQSIKKEYYSLTFEQNEKNIITASRSDGVFPLITNLRKHTPKKILEIYKYQPFLEKRHTQLKTYQEIAPVYLKKPERVMAYLHIHVISLMVATLIERQLRLNMKKQKIEYLPIYPEGKKCQFPTMRDIVRLFKNVERSEVIQGDNVMVFPARLTKTQKQVLDLLEVPTSLY